MSGGTGGRPAVSEFPPGGWRSNSSEGSCLEVNHQPCGWVAVRDSKGDAEIGLVIVITDWAAFVSSIREDVHTP
jgi:hypothetical protein